MSYRAYDPGSVMAGSVEDRLTFIRRTYLHLIAALALFVGLSAVFYTSGVGESVARFVFQSQAAWFLIIGGLLVASWVAQSLARSRGALPVQYAGLALYATAEAFVFSPLLFIAARMYPGVLPQATILTAAIFLGLTAFTFLSKSDFSFLGPILCAIGFGVLGLIVVAILFGLSLGTWFSAGMVLFASAAIVYSTSNVIRQYPADQYVAAALDLFAAVVLLFWYILRFLMGNRR